MESPILPTPPSDYPYIIVLLVAFLSVGLIVIGFGARTYLAYRDKREAEDKAYRDDQIKRQTEHWEKESAARDAFRVAFEARQDKRFDKIESDTSTFFRDLEAELSALKGENSALRQDFAGLKKDFEHFQKGK